MTEQTEAEAVAHGTGGAAATESGAAAPGLTVTDHPDLSRYELRRGDELLGRIDYRRDGDRVSLDHTVVDRHRREKGLGSALVRGALDDLRRQGATLVPQCPFVAQYVQERPEYADLVG